MSTIIPTSQPFTSDVLQASVTALAAKYPCVDVSVIGHSRKGFPLYALKLGYGAVSYMYNASHHANEWITSVILMRFAEECAASIYPAWLGWANGKEPCGVGSAPWYERVTLHLVPMVNPDGVDLVAGSAGLKHWKANAIGVDLNSNYPAGWHLAKTHKYARGYTAPGARDYVGPAPLSEPESMAMAAYTQFVDCDMTISLHTQGEVIYWRYMDYMPPGAEELARKLSLVSGYELEDVPDYSSHGGYRDWFIERFNRPGFTVECGLGESPLPIGDFDGIYERVRRVLWVGVEE